MREEIEFSYFSSMNLGWKFECTGPQTKQDYQARNLNMKPSTPYNSIDFLSSNEEMKRVGIKKISNHPRFGNFKSATQKHMHA